MLLSADSLIANPQGWADNFCNECILVLRDMAEAFGVSYAELNIFLFCILMPLLILYFIALALANAKWHNKTLRRVTIISAIVTILLPFIMLAIDVFYWGLKAQSPIG